MIIARIIGVLLVFGLAGCVTAQPKPTLSKGESTATIATSEGIEAPVRVVSPETEAQLNRVGFLTKGLAGRIAVEQTGARRSATNTLEIHVTLRNRTDYPQKIEVRSQFYGDGRVALEGPGAWESVFLAPNGIQTYRTSSTRTDPVAYYIEVREMR